MNFNNQPCGFASGETNPAKTDKQRAQSSTRFKLNNPNNNPDSVAKRTEKLKGRPSKRKGVPHSDESRRNMSIGRTGIKISDDGRQKLSKSRKQQVASGERTVPSFKGYHHSDERNQQMSVIALQRERFTCPHCGKVADLGNFTRWHGNRCKLNPIPQ